MLETQSTITLYLFEDNSRYRAVLEPAGSLGEARYAEAYPVRRFIEGGRDWLEALVIMQGPEKIFQTFRFTWSGSNWVSNSAPIAKVHEIDLLV